MYTPTNPVHDVLSKHSLSLSLFGIYLFGLEIIVVCLPFYGWTNSVCSRFCIKPGATITHRVGGGWWWLTYHSAVVSGLRCFLMSESKSMGENCIPNPNRLSMEYAIHPSLIVQDVPIYLFIYLFSSGPTTISLAANNKLLFYVMSIATAKY